jgi:plastocyanin
MIKQQSKKYSIVILLVGMLILPACQSAGTSTTKTEAPPAATQAPSQPSEGTGTQAVVNIADNKFDPKELTIKAGTTVTFTNTGNRTHTVTADDGSFDSGRLLGGAAFEFTFTEPGEYPFYCEIHGGPGGSGMSGVIIVTAGD